MTEKMEAGRMPPGARYDLRRRLERHEARWAVREVYFFVFFRSAHAYVRVGFQNPSVRVRGEDFSNLCRLEWTGEGERWVAASWEPIEGDYIPVRLGGRSLAGTPEACVDASLKRLFGWDPPATSAGGAFPAS